MTVLEKRRIDGLETLIQQQETAILALTDQVVDLKAEQQNRDEVLKVLTDNAGIQVDLNRGFLLKIEALGNALLASNIRIKHLEDEREYEIAIKKIY